MPVTKIALPAKSDDSSRGTFARTIAPLIPLAIGLGHAMMSSNPVDVSVPATAITDSRSAPISPPVATGPVSAACTSGVPCPLLAKGHPVDWWFVFKMNSGVFPQCGDGKNPCLFGGTPQGSAKYPVSQRFVFASSEQPTLADGGQECAGTSTGDPLGATFDEVYNGGLHYILWNDQFYDTDPSAVQGCSKGDCGSPWGHSKGLLAWNDAGQGMVMQVSTPEWPGSGNAKFMRKIGNTLGCLSADDDVKVSQHFFALRLTKDDLVAVLKGLRKASVVTDPNDQEIAQIGGPTDVVGLAKALGTRSTDTTMDPLTPISLSTNVKFIAKPSGLHVPPWQMVSSVLGGVALRAATWWTSPAIDPTTTSGVPPGGCWDGSLKTPPGPVAIATSGSWQDHVFQLTGGGGNDSNHAKVGVSTSGAAPYVIFGDENQQGTLAPKTVPKIQGCDSSQNGRGGTFYVMQDAVLAKSVGALLAGDSAPVP